MWIRDLYLSLIRFCYFWENTTGGTNERYYDAHAFLGVILMGYVYALFFYGCRVLHITPDAFTSLQYFLIGLSVVLIYLLFAHIKKETIIELLGGDFKFQNDKNFFLVALIFVCSIGGFLYNLYQFAVYARIDAVN
ncbi:hypothetical protein N8482_03580 [Chitinophagales bacterium]|nr:hypothetical protein [Chitinophagales bacterium]